MLTDLPRRVLHTLKHHRMLRAGDRVAVGVSGGADSVTLLLILQDLVGELGVQLSVAHFHHRLRGREADDDQRFVASLAARCGLLCHTESAEVAGESIRSRANLEETARLLRYRFFQALVDRGIADRIAVAHTADDQAETVLGHLMRGTGPTGLAGIYAVAGPVIRPLLQVRRSELRQFLLSRGQQWREDSSNSDLSRTRNRIRHSLLPFLEQQFQPRIVEHISSLAALAHQHEQYWNALTAELASTLFTHHSEGVGVAAATLLSPLSTPGASSPLDAPREAANTLLAGRLVRTLFGEVRGHRRGLSLQHVDRVLRLAAEGTSGQRVELPGHVVVERRFDTLLFRKADPAKPTQDSGRQYAYEFSLPPFGETTVTVSEIGRRLSLKVIDWPAWESETSVLADILDRDRLTAPLVLRNWRPGDVFRPRGHRSTRKLKRLFLERHIVATDRRFWPVLTSAGRVVWSRGLSVAEGFAVRSASRRGVVIAEESL